jgi:hypothetical protein
MGRHHQCRRGNPTPAAVATVNSAAAFSMAVASFGASIAPSQTVLLVTL